MTANGTIIESGVSTAVKSCFCQTRNGWLIRVNGAARGSISKSGATAVPLGITAPASGPTVTQVAESGSLFKGDYYCAYRYRDDDYVYSSLSPATKVTADKNDALSWSATNSQESRVTAIQLYRTACGKPDVFYLVSELATGVTTLSSDAASDATLLAATGVLPLLNDDRTLCARRFGVPPTTASIVVPYRDRYYYIDPVNGIIYFSYPDEPESVPSTNAITLQPNSDDNDAIVGAWSSDSLWIIKQRHIYELSCTNNPLYSSGVRMLYARGACNQSCFAMLEGVMYGLDEMGPWKMSGDGAEPLALPVQDKFRDGTVLWSSSSRFFVSTDPNERLVRFHVHLLGDSGTYPRHALVYNANDGSWHQEDYTRGLSCGCHTVASGRSRALFGAEDGRLLVSYEVWADALGDGISGVVTSATTETLTDTAVTFTALYEGATITMTKGASRGQTRQIVSGDEGHTLNVSPAWTTTPVAGDCYTAGSVPFTYKTGMLELPVVADEDRKQWIPAYDLVVDYKPTTLDNWVTIRLYWDHSATPINFEMIGEKDGLRYNANGAIELNLRSADTYGNATGQRRIRINARAEARVWTHRALSVEVFGAQYSEEICFYKIALEEVQ
jgi:hypothetical protein